MRVTRRTVMAGEYCFSVSAIVNNIFGSAARVAAAARELLWGVAVHCAALAAPMPNVCDP